MCITLLQQTDKCLMFIMLLNYSVAERIRVVAFETVKLRDQEGVGSNPGSGQVGGVFILVETHKVSLLKGFQ